MLVLKNFSVSIGGGPAGEGPAGEGPVSLLTDVNLVFSSGQTVIIAGHNGSGKSTLAAGIMGLAGYHPEGNIALEGNDITTWSVEQRAQAGIFLAYQYPMEIPGLAIRTFLHHAYRSCKGATLSLHDLDKKIDGAFQQVGLPPEYSVRNVHEGFSGGQKKRFELVQMLVLEPRIIIVDEIDSGLDATGIAMVIRLIAEYKATFPETLFIIITHNTALYQHLAVDKYITMQGGRVLDS